MPDSRTSTISGGKTEHINTDTGLRGISYSQLVSNAIVSNLKKQKNKNPEVQAMLLNAFPSQSSRSAQNRLTRATK